MTRLIFDEDFIDTVVELHGCDKTDVTIGCRLRIRQKFVFLPRDIRAFNPVPVQKSLKFAEDSDMLYIMYTSGTTGYQRRGPYP